uniref:Ig-like domain-containing protein n=1 Tax=Callithrix jacchus TaxID=9483 RepID=A0A5F4WM56_CALJA
MRNRLLCCVIICLLKADFKNAIVTQFPRHRIIGTGKEFILHCSQNMNHVAMFWYRQDPGFGLKLVYYSPGPGSIEKGDVSEGYHVFRNNMTHFPLTLKSASTNQTSVYLCASSSATAPHTHILSAQKKVQTTEEKAALKILHRK